MTWNNAFGNLSAEEVASAVQKSGGNTDYIDPWANQGRGQPPTQKRPLNTEVLDPWAKDAGRKAPNPEVLDPWAANGGVTRSMGYTGNPVDLSKDQGFQNDVARQMAQSNGMQKRAEMVDAGGSFAGGSFAGGGAGAGAGGGAGGAGGAGGMMGGLAGMMGGGKGGGGGGGGMLSGKNDAAAGGGTTDKAQQLGNLWSVFGKIFGG